MLLVAFVLLATTSAHAQTPPYLVALTKKLDCISTITFGSAPLVDDKEIAQDAVKALVRLAKATSEGLNYREFTSKLAEVKGVVEAALRKMTESSWRKDIDRCLSFYVDAQNYWRVKTEQRTEELILSEGQLEDLKRRYGAHIESGASPIAGSTSKRISIDFLVKAIWERAADLALVIEKNLEKAR